MARSTSLTGREVTFGHDEIIVSKTDTKGRITYANDVFQRVSGYSEDELLGAAHNIVRHPAMPRCVFRFLWDRIAAGNEVFAYVLNRCKTGDQYWVFAHVTPTFGAGGSIVSYHSSRRVPAREAIAVVKPLYAQLMEVERQHQLPREQWEASLPVLVSVLESKKLTYDELVFAITP
ncbi:MAG: PAS domain-containing protein [Phycisphaerales bacterium]